MLAHKCQSYLLNNSIVSFGMDTIGKRITYAKTLAGYNTPELAKLIGVSRQALNQMELDKTKNPKPENLLKIADITGYELRWLITGKGPQTKKEAAKDRIDISKLPSDSQAVIRALLHSLGDQGNKKPNHSS